MLKIFNTLGRELQEFKPIEKSKVGIYTCGPTVYNYVSIGNWRTYILGDIAIRSLQYLGYDVKYIMNITDVGHLTGDNEGDADTGEDRLEKASKRENKSAWDIAEYYTKDFQKGFDALNLTKPEQFTKATDHIEEQIALIKKLEEKKLTYKIKDGIYFDVKEYEQFGYKYGELSTLDQRKEGARVEKNKEKKDPRDFALWKFSPKDEKRHMEWDSPWGTGFPGWHLECSAMGMKYLGDQFDVHIGGEDLASTHHPNEIAQSEGATDKTPFVRYWIHGSFLLVDGGRMGKSLGNAYSLHDIKKKGFNPLDLRYFYLQAHYRSQQNFTWEALEAAKKSHAKLVNLIQLFRSDNDGDVDQANINQDYKKKFIASIEDDFNLPKALAVVWDLTKDSQIESSVKIKTLLDFDQVLGLNLNSLTEKKGGTEKLSDEAQELLEKRKKARAEKDWKMSDQLRDELKNRFGIEVRDTDGGQVVK